MALMKSLGVTVDMIMTACGSALIVNVDWGVCASETTVCMSEKAEVFFPSWKLGCLALPAVEHLRSSAFSLGGLMHAAFHRSNSTV